ncbi:Lrp/AsnC family transcriptional regulator [Saccharopolyspora spinosa]|uniref:AsnC family transcriptional regulator n=1 Tax=Saccharopolyspora spinosa TaxID=60894 RepID=A0A2N3XXR2_SACSN|nr:Lrp/AsnC family transcriptional regulator [Saccharopolyspora spinosa]PKW15465.1 AsnC family transcriptional regulator [Saccharopolyspora spinosa]
MDSIDRAIISQLRRNCRQSNIELAEAVGLTPSPCLRRVKRLEDEGIITGYHASIAPAAVDRGFEVLVEIELKDQSPASTKKFEAELIAHDEVIEARRMFGSPDFRLLVATKDLAAYEAFVTNKLLTLPGLGNLQSHFPMLTIKSDPPRASGRPRS